MWHLIQQGATARQLLDEAERIEAEDRAANYAMGDAGAAVIQRLSGMAGLYTHCNTGSLATAGYGTALGVVRSAYSQGLAQQIYAGETRPWLQGARLTLGNYSKIRFRCSSRSRGRPVR